MEKREPKKYLKLAPIDFVQIKNFSVNKSVLILIYINYSKKVNSKFKMNNNDMLPCIIRLSYFDWQKKKM